jgi:hypothetical protein
MGLKDSQFNDWNTLSFLFLLAFSGFAGSISGIDPEKDARLS